MAFENIKRPYPPAEWRTIDRERGIVLRHLNPEEGVNSQGYIEMVLETPGGNLEFEAYMKGGQIDSITGICHLGWVIRGAHWVPPRANMTESEIKGLIREAFEMYGFLFEKKEKQEMILNFETINTKGLSSWH